MTILKILMGIGIWIGFEISIAVGVSMGLRSYFENHQK